MIRTIGRMILVVSSIALGIITLIECMFLGSYFMKTQFELISILINCICFILMAFSCFIGIYTVIKNNSGKLLIIYGLAIFMFGVVNLFLYIWFQPNKDIWLAFTIMDMICGGVYFLGAVMARERIK